MRLSGVVKFLLGFILAIAILFLTGLVVTRYLLFRISALPPRPTFPNDSPSSPKKPPVAASPVASASPSPANSVAAATPSPTVTPSPTTGYPAKVTEPIGLILRQDPNPDSEQLGGVDYNQVLTVLESSADGAWQRVRLSNGLEGWVRGNNTERVN